MGSGMAYLGIRTMLFRIASFGPSVVARLAETDDCSGAGAVLIIRYNQSLHDALQACPGAILTTGNFLSTHLSILPARAILLICR